MGSGKKNISNSNMNSLKYENYINELIPTIKNFKKLNKKGLLSNKFKKFIKETKGVYNDVDYLKPINKTYNFITNNIVKRSMLYTNKGVLRKKYKEYNEIPIYEISDLKINKKYNTEDYTLTLKNTPKTTILEYIDQLTKKISSKISGLFRIIIYDNSDKKITWSHPFINIEELNNKLGDNLQKKYYNYLVSKLVELYDSINFNKMPLVVFQTNKIPIGGSCIKLPKWLENKQGIFTILNDDDLCGQMCLSVFEHKKKDSNAYKNLRRKDRGPKQLKKLCNKMCNVLSFKKRMSFLDFDIYSKTFKRMVIIFNDISGNPIHTSEDYRNDKEDTESIVYLFYDVTLEHYHLITKIEWFFLKNNVNNLSYKWCVHCLKSYDNNLFNKHDCKKDKCKCCQTFNIHSKIKNWVNCEYCNSWCLNDECLKLHIENNHKYKVNGKGFKKGDLKAINFYKCLKCKTNIDYNRYHNNEHKCGEVKCNNCEEYFIDIDKHRCNIKIPDIKEGSKNEIIVFDFESKFNNEGVHIVNLACTENLNTGEKNQFENIEDFINYVLKQKNKTFIAHNLKGYDGWLIHNHLIQNFKIKPNKIVLAGQKIMTMQFKSIRFIDSLNFIQAPLSAMPNIFGLNEDNYEKGYFPYIMNKDEYLDYEGPMPPRELYEYNKLKPSSKNIKKYKCIDIATTKTIEDFHNWYNEQVKNKYVYNFKNELLKYCVSDVSILCESLRVFMNDMIEQNGINPFDSVTIASYCMKVYLTKHAPTEKELDNRNISDFRFTAIGILKKDEAEQIKKGFHGGRTEVFKQFMELSDKELLEGLRLAYEDINSLYPTCQYFDELPYGIPKIFDYGDKGIENIDITKYFGYVVCDVIPPKDLLIPLLGSKNKDGKFTFSLENMYKETIPTPELIKSLELGYKITRVYKIFHFKKTTGLFKSYIQCFLRAKVENGFKGTDEEKDILIDKYKKIGVTIRKDRLCDNPGRKNNAKLMLNSLWGKFGQRQMNISVYINEPSKWYNILRRVNKKEIILITRENLGDSLFIQYKEVKECNMNFNKTNIALCGMITSQARLRLYKVIGDKRLSNRVIYCDTDSCIYLYDKNKYNNKTGDMLGEWEAETDEPIKKIVCLAPKAYSYITASNKKEIKSKGIQLTAENIKENVNFNYYKKMIDDNNNIIKCKSLIFKKTYEGMYTKYDDKILKLDPKCFKRKIINNYNTVPYGYKSM
jgi:hypothetical protein